MAADAVAPGCHLTSTVAKSEAQFTDILHRLGCRADRRLLLLMVDSLLGVLCRMSTANCGDRLRRRWEPCGSVYLQILAEILLFDIGLRRN